MVRDTDLLLRLARASSVRVCVSIATVDADLARRAEAEAPPPRARLAAVRRLRSAGIDAGVLAAPLLPGLSDDERSLDAIAAAARAHDAAFFSTRPLKLDPGVRPHYFAFLAESFPVLLAPTGERFADRVTPDPRYAGELERRIDRIRARHGFADEPARVDARPARAEADEPGQLRLAI